MYGPPYQPSRFQHQQPPAGFICPFCHTTIPPMHYVKVSLAGWVIFVVLLVSCFGILFAWVGLLFKERYTRCQACGIKLG